MVYTHFITGGANCYKVALRNKHLDANEAQKLNHDKKFYDETYLATLNKGDFIVLLNEYEYCYFIKAICTNAKNGKMGWQEGYIIKSFQGKGILKKL